MLKVFSVLEQIVIQDMPTINRAFPISHFADLMKNANIPVNRRIETGDENLDMSKYYTYVINDEYKKIKVHINKTTAEANSEEQLKKFIKGAFIKLCQLKKECDELNSNFNKIKSTISEDKWKNIAIVMAALDGTLIKLIYELSDYNYLLPQDLRLKYHPHWENLRIEKLELEHEYDRQVKEYCQYVEQKINTAKTPSDALQYLLNEIRKCKILAVQSDLDKARSLVSEKWYLDKQIEYLNVQVDCLRQTMGTAEAEKNLEKIDKATVSSSQASDPQSVSKYDNSKLKDYFFTEKIDDFKKLETELQQSGFLDERGYWHYKKRALVALIYILMDLEYLRPQQKGKGKIRFTYRKFFELRYNTDISKQMQPLQFDHENDIKPYKADYHFITGIDAI